MASVRQASAARKVSSRMCHVCMRSSARRDPAPHTSAMRDSPRLVASAIRVARKACSSPGGNPVETCPKCWVKPVHRSTCDSTSVIRVRSEEHTSELQSLMRISYAVFCLKKTTTIQIYYIFNFITLLYYSNLNLYIHL